MCPSALLSQVGEASGRKTTTSTRRRSRNHGPWPQTANSMPRCTHIFDFEGIAALVETPGLIGRQRKSEVCQTPASGRMGGEGSSKVLGLRQRRRHDLPWRMNS